jgi:hypothetical protein
MKTLCQNAFQEVHESRVGTDGLIRTDGNPYIFYEKLAMLIVKECTDVLNQRIIGDFNREDIEVRRCIADVNKHFGVEL